MQTRCWPLAIGLVLLSCASAGAQVKGGEDETGSVDAEGNLYIADSFGGRTQKYAPAKAGDRTKLLVPVK